MKRSLILLLALALAPACDRRRPATSLMDLEHSLLTAGRVEVFAPEGAPRERAVILLEELESRGDFQGCLGVPADSSFKDASSARLIFGTTADDEVLRLAQPLGIETTPGERGFKIFGETFRSPTDALVFTREDPERPGLPVTVYATNDELTLQNWMQDLEPCSRPGVRVFGGGVPALAAECGVDGSPWLGTLFDYRALRREAVRPGAVRSVAVAGGAALLVVPPNFRGEERLVEYAARLEEALGRVDQLLPDVRRKRPPLRIFVFDHTAAYEMAGGHSAQTSPSIAAPRKGEPGAFGGGLALARTNPVGRSVDVLLAEGLPDDGGAAAATLRAFDRAGPVAASWIADGLGIHSSGTWWGRDLREWTTRLIPGEVPLGESRAIARALIDEALKTTASDTLPAHLVLPLRGLIFERVAELWSAEREGRQDWNGLWTAGAVAPLVSTAASELALELSDLAIERVQSASATVRSLPDPQAPLVLGWEFEEDGPSYGSKEASKAFAAAAEAGASRVELRSTFAVVPPRPRFAPVARTYAFAPIEGDLAIAGGLAAARSQGLETGLCPDLLLSPSGSRFSERVRTKRGPEAAAAWVQTFETYTRFVQHYALLAELCDADSLLLGTGALDLTQTTGDVSTWDDPAFESWLRAGWDRVIQSARRSFGGRLGYRAAWPTEARRIEFWDQLDFCVLSSDTEFRHPQSPYRRPDDGLISGKYSRWLTSMRTFADERELELRVTAYLPASSEAWRDPSTPAGGESDAHEQERLAASLAWALRGLEKEGLAPEAIMIHGARTDPHAGGAGDRDFTVQNKPALDALRVLTKERSAPSGD